jgi:tetratricopeptide (TPR) repeat protein
VIKNRLVQMAETRKVVREFAPGESMLSTFTRFLMLATIACASTTLTAAATPTPIDVPVNLFGGEAVNDEILLVTFDREIRFSVPAARVADGSDAERALSEAINTQRLITLKIDWEAARFENASHRIIFPVCVIQFQELVSMIDAKCRHKRTASSGQLLLAQAVARRLADDFESATPLLDRAIDSPDLDQDWRLTARNFRADNEFTIGFGIEAWSEAQDRHFLAALNDIQIVIAKDDSEQNKTLLADLLSRLGAYDEAMAIVSRQLADDSDPEHFQATVTAASIARLQGKPDRALELLNALRSNMTSEPGMKFYYHRGRTLMLLGRFDEAIADFTAGIANQADYASAYFLRGCAYSAVGKPQAALDDYVSGKERASVFLGPVEERRRAIIDRMIASARSASAEGNTRPDTGICEDYLDKLDASRARSKLLPSKL